MATREYETTVQFVLEHKVLDPNNLIKPTLSLATENDFFLGSQFKPSGIGTTAPGKLPSD